MSKFTDEERIEKVKEVADYIIATGDSTRNAAKAFNISNATVSTWMSDLLKKIDYEKYCLVKEKLAENTPKTVEDDEIRNRVLDAANLIIHGFTVEEIAKKMNVTTNIINEDLQTRLSRISTILDDQVKIIQRQNSLNNLNIGSNMSVEGQARDENGRFKR